MSPASARTILVVEDDRVDRTTIRRMLGGVGREIRIVEAESGAEGLQQARQARPDCILLDFRLPDMDALEFLAALAEQKDRPTFPVAILTGSGDADRAPAALGRGAQDYILKGSLTAPGLLRSIENAIEKFAIVRELIAKREMLELRNQQLEAVREELEANLAELTDATRAKDRFMAVMSHEMRTPLNAVLGYVDLLEMGIGGALSDVQKEYTGRIRVGSRHLLDLINDVLDLARADAHRLELDLRAVDVFAVAEEVVALLDSQAQPKRIELRLDPCPADFPLARADLQRLRQILTNLIGNAIKFTDEGGRVTVRCEQADDRVRLVVEDTGIGIDARARDRIFAEFFQADGDLTRRQGGSGLGLAISQRLARLMGGEIDVRSEVGVGSTFTLALRPAGAGSQPRREDVESQAARMQAHRSALPAARRARADQPATAAGVPTTVVAFGADEEALQELGQRVHHGVDLVWTTAVDEVPRLAGERQAALIVIDIACAGGAGWNAAHALRDDPQLASIPLLLLPCIPRPDPERLGSGLDLGWVTLVPKPFTPDQLTQAVRAAARGGATPADGAVTEVLVVDDDADSRRVAARFLLTGPVHVREAEDGESALVEMRRRPPDVVVLDLMMPVLDGFGVLAAMRSDPLLTHLPVVVLSAKSLSAAERQFLARSAVRVLQKGEHRLADVAALVLRAADAGKREEGSGQS